MIQTDPTVGGYEKTLGRRIRARRTAMGVSQTLLGKRSCVLQTRVSDYERGTKAMTIYTLLKIAAALDTTASILLEGIL